MPANHSPDHKAAEAAFRTAREPKEQLEYLRERTSRQVTP